MQNQQFVHVPPRQLTEQETGQYFFPRKVPLWAWITVIFGILIAIIGCILTFNLIAISIGVILCVIGAVAALLIRKSNPTDEQYDLWLEKQVEDIYVQGLQIHNLDEHDLIDQGFCVRSIVPPGTTLVGDYPTEEVHMKRGKDGQWRCSITVYTYIFFTQDFLSSV